MKPISVLGSLRRAERIETITRRLNRTLVGASPHRVGVNELRRVIALAFDPLFE